MEVGAAAGLVYMPASATGTVVEAVEAAHEGAAVGSAVDLAGGASALD